MTKIKRVEGAYSFSKALKEAKKHPTYWIERIRMLDRFEIQWFLYTRMPVSGRRYREVCEDYEKKIRSLTLQKLKLEIRLDKRER